MPNIGFWATAGAGGGASGNALPLISTQVLTGTASTISFTSIPSTFKHLQLRIAARPISDGNAAIQYRFNSDTGSNYFWRYLASSGTMTSYGVTPAATQIKATLFYWGMSATFPTAQVCDILDYANVNKWKTLRAFSGQTGSNANELGLHSGHWENTSAISSIDILINNCATGSRFSLYGVS